MQIEKLKNIGSKFSVYCQKGAFSLLLKNKVVAKKAIINKNKLKIKNGNNFIIDHDNSLINADITFIHNIPVENESNTSYFNWLKKSSCTVISNSYFTKRKLLEQGFNKKNITVIYPGYNNNRFNLLTRESYRKEAREKLSLNNNTKLIGFITSGDFDKRGLSHFLKICEKISNIENVKYFIMGSKKLPSQFLDHPIIQSEKFIYKPKNPIPEYWLSAVDIFVYPANFEEFGMVIPEALSMGIPVITTRNVGASEILPNEYQEWLSDSIDIDWFVDRTVTLLNDDEKYNNLSLLSVNSLSYNHEDYAIRTIKFIRKIAEDS
jgi:glycosyltransferase involved in cell wall biosynthesis